MERASEKAQKNRGRRAAILAGAAALVLCLMAFTSKRTEPETEAANAKAETPAAPQEPAPAPIAASSDEPALQQWCKDLDVEVKRLGWKLPACNPKNWKLGGKSVRGRPLVYAEFGNPANGENRTLIFSMVHPDEITPLYLALQLVNWLERNPDAVAETHVVIAPLVNPDGFYRIPKTRTNARGVDLNRNFATADWRRDALKAWKQKTSASARRFPGKEPNSEPETAFQSALIEQMQPHKVLSLHSPLNYFDYDGPSSISLNKFPRDYVRRCLQLRSRLKAQSGGFYPGSLGNYAGQERGIPTLTLELPTANARKAGEYWNTFSQGIRTLIQFEVPAYVFRDSEESSDGSIN